MTSGTNILSAVPPCLFPIQEIPSDSNKSYPLTRADGSHYSAIFTGSTPEPDRLIQPHRLTPTAGSLKLYECDRFSFTVFSAIDDIKAYLHKFVNTFLWKKYFLFLRKKHLTFSRKHARMQKTWKKALTKTVEAEELQRADGWCKSVFFPSQTHPFRAGVLNAFP